VAFRQFEWLAPKAVAGLNWRFEWLAPNAVALEWLAPKAVADLNFQYEEAVCWITTQRHCSS
jgi:hypothetical protein